VYILPRNIDANAFIIDSFPLSFTSNKVIRNFDGSLDGNLFRWIDLRDVTEYCQDR
jgi:hypothetical protein